MRIFYFIITLIIISLNSCNVAHKELEHSEKTRHEKWMEDITYFEHEFLLNSKPYPQDSIVSCKALLANLEAEIDELSDNQMILKLSRCVAMANNGHTGLSLKMNKVPLLFFRFSDGLYIIKTDSVSSKYLGSKVLKINSIEVDEVQEKLSPYLSGISRWKNYRVPIFMNSPEVLHGIGIGKKNSLTLRLLKDNDIIDVSFDAKKIELDRKGYPDWANLHPNPSKNSIWRYVKDSNEDLPLYLEKLEEGVFYEFMDTEKIAYFSINGLWKQCPNFKGKINAFLDLLATKTDYNVIIDLRFFTGGNYMLPIKLASKPPKIIDDDKKIYLITSNLTFSAGLVTAARIKYFAKDKIVIVGQEVGDNLKFWAEGIRYKLPHSGVKIYDSKREHDWENDKFIPLRTFWINLFYGVAAKDLAVDKEIQISFEDYLENRDPILNWILNEKN